MQLTRQTSGVSIPSSDWHPIWPFSIFSPPLSSSSSLDFCPKKMARKEKSRHSPFDKLSHGIFPRLEKNLGRAWKRREENAFIFAFKELKNNPDRVHFRSKTCIRHFHVTCFAHFFRLIFEKESRLLFFPSWNISWEVSRFPRFFPFLWEDRSQDRNVRNGDN